MLTRTFTYKGYDGKPHTETYYFNLDEAELYKLELGSIGGVNGLMTRLMREEKPKEIVDLFETVILGSVGEKSADGRRFVKRDGAVAKDFKETPAYSQLFVELVSSGEALAAFLKGIIPEDVAEKIEEKERNDEAAKENGEKPALTVVTPE